MDRYTSLDGLTYSTATATLGLEGVNYLRTRYAYNDQGHVERVQNPAGTITISTFDGLRRLTGTYVGTNDSTTNGFKWKPSNAAPASNMVQVAAYEYDNGGVGNGNLTKATQFPGSGDAARVTQNAYDWRNRLVATKSGATGTLATEDPSVNRPLSFTDYDNLDRSRPRTIPLACPLQDRTTAGTVCAGAAREGMLPGFSLSSCLDLVDHAARLCRTSKARITQEVAGIMTRLGTSPEYWRSHLQKLLGKTRWLGSYCATSAERLKAIAAKRNAHHMGNILSGLATG